MKEGIGEGRIRGLKRRLSYIMLIIGLCLNLAEAASQLTVVDNINHLRLSLDIIEKDACSFLSISEVAKVFQTSIAWNPIMKKITLSKDKDSIVFEIGSAKVLINESVQEMYPPAQLIAGRVYMPIKFIKQEFGPVFDVQINWDKDNNKMVISPRGVTPLVALRSQDSPELTDNPTDSQRAKELIVNNRFLSSKQAQAQIPTQNVILPKRVSSDRFRIKTIVLDPGHGGHDSGAVGKNGLLEKTVVLEMALDLRVALQQALPDTRILMTREGDYFVPLRERTAFANYKKADLFISLHSNAAFSRTANGFEVFFLSPDASDNESRSLAAAENEVLKLEERSSKKELTTAELILGGLAQEEFINESIELAGLIQESVTSSLGIEDRGIKSAFFWVLKDAMMPAVLIENGFISNPLEESRLRTKEFRKQIVDAIASAIVNYKASYEERLKISK